MTAYEFKQQVIIEQKHEKIEALTETASISPPDAPVFVAVFLITAP